MLESIKFLKQFDCPIGFVPILGPLEHNELLYEREAARLALFSYKAARNFRNIWHHYPERFEEFRELLKQTWPGMDIQPPEIDRTHDKPRLHMYCPEVRIPRELFWSGFGFQVWCQMLTHMMMSKNVSIFLIDEPDIYLHSELQRQLLGILKTLGPDVIIATHSTEMITEAETTDIVVISKSKTSARRIKDSSQLEPVFRELGSTLNPVLTQLAKTKRVLFLEGKDFQILGKFARKMGYHNIANRRDFAVVPVEGFNPERIRNLKAGMEATLGTSIKSAAILDRDYRCPEECQKIEDDCSVFCDFVKIHDRKEIESFLLNKNSMNRAAERRVEELVKRSENHLNGVVNVESALEDFCSSKKNYVAAQFMGERKRFGSKSLKGISDATVNEMVLKEFDEAWASNENRISMIPAKDALSYINKYLQEHHAINVTPISIIDAMHVDEVPHEMKLLIEGIGVFSKS